MDNGERDEKISARYRELGSAEPPARLDDAILAASRRAVHAGPGGRSVRRWAVPVSLAAAVVLSVMVTLHVQEELPGLETPAPAAPPTAPAAETAKVEKQVSAANEAPAPERKPAPPPAAKAKDAPRPAEAREDARREQPRFTPEPAAAPASPPPPAPVLAQRAPDTGPAAVGALSSRSNAGAGVASSPAPSSAPAPLQMRERASRDMADAVAKRAEEADTPERQLERIAALRREGRHAEADKLLAEFRQRYPQYRIPEATLEKVQPSR